MGTISWMLILKCLILGIVWAAIILPVIFNQWKPLKYIIMVVVISIIFYLCVGFSSIINTMTVIALSALVLSWIISMAVFDRDSKIKSKIISFTCLIAALAYLASVFIKVNIL